jgi:hypothetical protein
MTSGCVVSATWAQGAFSRGDAVVIDADTGLEPLPIAVGQRYRGHRQPEDLTGHSGDAIEALARGRVQQLQLVQGV